MRSKYIELAPNQLQKFLCMLHICIFDPQLKFYHETKIYYFSTVTFCNTDN